MSFIDLYDNNIWSIEDINNRVKALIRSAISIDDEFKAARLSRKENLTQEERNFTLNVDSIISNCIAEGISARQDNILLEKVLNYEIALMRLKRYKLSEGKPAVTETKIKLDENNNPVLDEQNNPILEIIIIEPEILPITEYIDNLVNPEWEKVLIDNQERAIAKTIVDSASSEVLDLANKRILQYE